MQRRERESTGDMALSVRLRELREAAGLKQFDVGLALRIPQAQVSRWENALSAPPPARLRQLAELYGVSTGWLISGDETKHPKTPIKSTDTQQGGENKGALRPLGSIRMHYSGALSEPDRADLQRKLLAVYDWLREREGESLRGLVFTVEDGGDAIVVHRISD